MANLTKETSNDIKLELGNFEDHESRIETLEEETNNQKTMIDVHATKIDDLVEKDVEHTNKIESLQSISGQIVDKTSRPKNLEGQDGYHTG